MLRITFFICDDMLATSVTLPMEQLKAADNMARARRKGQGPELDIRLASVDGKSVTSNTGIRLQPHGSLAEIRHSDITYLPALWRSPQRQVQRNQALLPWLRHQEAKNNIIAGVGTGCALMAEAGLLDDRAATTHWHYFDQFQRRYPRVQLKRQFFITRADNLYCTGSVNSLADLTVHFIQRHFDSHIARHVERHFFHEIRRAYPLVEEVHDLSEMHPDEGVIQAQVWLQENYGQEIRLANVAQQFDMSVRTFNRRFKAATGETPLQYLHNVRMEVARDLLQTSNLSVGEVAYRAGYQDLAHFTRLFKRLLGVTPSQYRTTVRAKMFRL